MWTGEVARKLPTKFDNDVSEEFLSADELTPIVSMGPPSRAMTNTPAPCQCISSTRPAFQSSLHATDLQGKQPRPSAEKGIRGKEKRWMVCPSNNHIGPTVPTGTSITPCTIRYKDIAARGLVLYTVNDEQNLEWLHWKAKAHTLNETKSDRFWGQGKAQLGKWYRKGVR
jgi:hypothetical protein